MRFERHFPIAAAAAAALTLAACGGQSISGIRADEPTLGKADAPVEMIEYASTSCGHCASFNNNTFHAFKEKHIDTGEVRYTMREIAIDSFAKATFVLARCVAPDKYYPVVDAVFRAQTALIQSPNPAEGIKQIGLSAGLTEEQYTKCLADDAAFKALDERVARNGKDGIEATPTFFLNGKKMPFSAEVTMETLSKAVADAKKK